MATVYLARDTRHGGRVAVKVLSPDIVGTVSGGERFTREIRITARLQHPNILPVFDSGAVDGLPYYVMPYVEGQTLAERIERDGALPVPEALEIACEVADALSHAHDQGFVHRDIKPGNILLAHGHAMLADFGIARAVEAMANDDALTKTGFAVGTAAYMSPEQAAAGKVDGRSDIYALGCVVYEMLAGHPPFAAATPQALMARHWADTPPSIRTVRPSISPAVESTIMKAMAKMPGDRYADARQFKSAIKDIDTRERMAGSLGGPAVEPAPPPGAGMTNTPMSAPRAAFPDGRAFAGIGLSRSRMALLGAAAVLGISALAWQLGKDGSAALDESRVMVYPLVVPADFRGSRSIGEDVATMIGSALDQSGPLKLIDAWPLLEPSVRQNIRILSADDARSLARSKRCAFYMSGRVISRGDSAEIILELNDVEGDSLLARGNATGMSADAWRSGLRALNALLPAIIPGGAQSIIAEWSDRDPGAVASFLQGEAAFRRLHLTQALGHFRSAVDADSTFALAAIRGAQAAAGNHRSAEAQSLITVALRQPMSPRYMQFARGYESFLLGRADSAIADFQRVLAIDPEMSAAWRQLGEVYMHLLPLVGSPDRLAKAAFDSARRLDPAAPNVLYHAIEIRLRENDLRETPAMMQRFLAAQPDSIYAEQLKLMESCVRTGPAKMQWSTPARTSPFPLLAAANALKGAGAQLPCAKLAYDAVLSGATASDDATEAMRWYSLIGLQSVLLAEGRTSEAISRIDQWIARGQGGTSLYLLDAPYYPELREQAKRVAMEDELRFGAGYAGCPFPMRLWQLGIWEARSGRPLVAQSVARTLESRAAKSGEVVERLLAKSMASHAALARGDSADALRMLTELMNAEIPGGDLTWNLAISRGTDRLALAELLLARGNYQRAIDIADVFDSAWPQIYILYYPASLRVLADAASALGDTEAAARYRNRLATLRSGQTVAAR